MLKYSVKIRKDTTSYTGHIDSGDKKVSAQEMYTEMQNNSIKKYFTAQKWIFGILGFVMSYIGNGDDDFFMSLSVICFIVVFIYYWKGKKAQRTNINFDIDEKILQGRMKDVKNAFEFVNNAKEIFPAAGLWSIKYLDTNVDIYGWEDPTDSDEIFFMPDVCLVNVKSSGFAAIEYGAMHSGYVDHKDKSQYPPSDSEILGNTWLHTKKNGQPDRRFSNNPSIYSIKKGFTLISDSKKFDDNSGNSHFSAGLIISSPKIAKDFNSKMKKIFSSGNSPALGRKNANKSSKEPDSISKAFNSKSNKDNKTKVSKKEPDSISKAFDSKSNKDNKTKNSDDNKKGDTLTNAFSSSKE